MTNVENWHVRAVPVDLATEIRHRAVDLRLPVNAIVVQALRHWLEHANNATRLKSIDDIIDEAVRQWPADSPK